MESPVKYSSMVNSFHSNGCIYKSIGLIIMDMLNHFCGRHSVTNLSVNVSFPTWAVSLCSCYFEHSVLKQLINLPILTFSTGMKEPVVVISKKEYEEEGNTSPLKTISSEAITFANFSVNACFTVSATSAMRVLVQSFCLLAWSWSTFQCYHPMPPFTTDSKGTLGRYYHLVRT